MLNFLLIIALLIALLFGLWAVGYALAAFATIILEYPLRWLLKCPKAPAERPRPPSTADSADRFKTDPTYWHVEREPDPFATPIVADNEPDYEHSADPPCTPMDPKFLKVTEAFQRAFRGESDVR